MPRTKPYTAIGIKRKKCIRCGKQAGASWQACADGNVVRPMCFQCDIELNYMVVRWMNLPDYEDKIAAYIEKMKKDHGFTMYDAIKEGEDDTGTKETSS